MHSGGSSRITLTSIEPTMPLRLQDVYGYNSLQVGLIFMAADVPTLFGASLDSQARSTNTNKPLAASPLSGWLSAHINWGVEWTGFCTLLLSIPWWIVMAIRGPIALFATSFAVSSGFTSPSRDFLAQCGQHSFSPE